MINPDLLRKHPEQVRAAIAKRGMAVDIDEIIRLDDHRRTLQRQVEERRAFKNQAGEKIAHASPEERKRLIVEIKEFDTEQDRLEVKFAEADRMFHTAFAFIPNIPLDDVPLGKDETENRVIKTVGTPKKFAFPPKPAHELGVALGIIDIERAAKTSGSRFGFLLGAGAKLELALIRYALDEIEREGFTFIIPPVLVKEENMKAMGYLDRHEDEIYKIDGEPMRLVGTAEQVIGPMHRDEIFAADDLPRRYVAFSSCFRREAGSYGKDTKGILRVHQFDKIEMFSFCTPETSSLEQELFLSIQEKLMAGLGLSYRVVALCTGDLGSPSARTWDIETWVPSEGKYRETHSTSTTTDFQTRRLNIRYRGEQGTALLHAVNGTAFAIGRTIVAILENFQERDGSIHLPDILRPYLGFDRISASTFLREST